ncbi:MAG TPA: hypothetical protein VMN36_14125 [Verrucomicrobiales bacterium]|nr:hypothetical protein [Verrucomicrobiales bacterium]
MSAQQITDRVYARARAARAFDVALASDPTRGAQVRRATAFWKRLGEAQPLHTARESVAGARALRPPLAEMLQEYAMDAHHRFEDVTDALVYAAR